MARVIAWRIHHVAYVENLYPRRYSNLSTAFMRPMLPSWMRSRNCRPRLVYFLAIEMTSRRLASTIPFLAMAALVLARDSAALISCWATQICCCLGLWNFLAALRCRSETPLAAEVAAGS